MTEQHKNSRKKIKVKKHIFWDQKNEPFTWKDIKDVPFEDDDKINISWVESHYSENNSWDGHFHAEVIRMVEETDEQFKERIDNNERDAKWLKERRYENYLKLKEEFGETKCFDRMGVELNEGDTVDVQKAGKHTIYKGIYGDLCFKPYGKEEKVKDYFSNDIEKVL
jgi:hypothetical protein